MPFVGCPLFRAGEEAGQKSVLQSEGLVRRPRLAASMEQVGSQLLKRLKLRDNEHECCNARGNLLPLLLHAAGLKGPETLRSNPATSKRVFKAKLLPISP